MATILSTFTEVMLADTRRRSGTVLLPPLSAIPYRMLTFKDVYGTFSNSTLTISTQAGNTFEDSTTSVTLSNAYSFFNLYAASTSWVLLDGTQTLVQTISTLNVNSLNIGNGVGWLQLGPIQTVALSTTQIFTDSLYANSISSLSVSTPVLSVSSIIGAPLVYTSTLVSTTLGLQTYISTFIDTSELASTVRNLVSSTFFASQLASTVGGLGQAGYVSTAALLGIVSTPNLQNLVSTPNLLNLVSTNYLDSKLSNWSFYPATSNIVLEQLVPKIINPVHDTTCIFQSQNLTLQDSNNAPGTFFGNIYGILTSTNSEAYYLTNRTQLTGSVSSLGILYEAGSPQSGSLYLSSIYLGNYGGTIKGQLTTDATASDVYWNGTSLTSGGGGGITTGNLVSTTSGLQTNFIGKQGFFSTLFINMTSATAPAWSSSNPIVGSDPEPNPLALDMFGSARILKNLYVGSTTTIIGTRGINAQTISTVNLYGATLNMSVVFI